ncbi:hypothetical protein ABTZ03_29810, partial [Kitasatospora sp. NPDC096077]
MASERTAARHQPSRGRRTRQRVEDFVGWERDLPLRYLLVEDDSDLEDTERVTLLGRCVDAEGLYVTPVPPPRE